MRWSRKKWRQLAFKIGTGPKVLVFVRAADIPRLAVGEHLQVRRNDGVTNPDFQHDEGVLIDELRSIGTELLYVAERF